MEPGPGELLDVLEREGLVGGDRRALSGAEGIPALPPAAEKNEVSEWTADREEP